MNRNGGKQMNESVVRANEWFADLLYQDAILSKAMYFAICCISVVLILLTLYHWRKQKWSCAYFLLLCAAVFLWAVCSLLATFAQEAGAAELWKTLGTIGLMLIPPLLCLHIRRQVSYKELHPAAVVVLFIVPALLGCFLLRGLLGGAASPTLSSVDSALWLSLVFYLYAIVVFIRCYLLCFNVFYQMPRHMRRSTHYMLASTSAVAILFFAYALWNSQLVALVPQSPTLDILLQLAAPIALCILLFPLYNALHLAPSENVIVTSREFVFGSLSTTILVLSKKKRILDWNKKDWAASSPFPQPLFREPVELYRKRILEESRSRISPHSENVIMTSTPGGETSFLFSMHEIQNRKRKFGYVVEISEVTPVYTLLRYFEEIAHFDRLTGLHNRNAYINQVAKYMQAGTLPLLILVGDVNKLKQVNDIHGHLLGDALLAKVTDFIKAGAPAGAFVARIGGDEFVLLVPNGSADTAERFIKQVNALCAQSSHEIWGRPSVSWGYAVMTSASQSYNEMFSAADRMMYEYKKKYSQYRSSGLVPDEPNA